MHPSSVHKVLLLASLVYAQSHGVLAVNGNDTTPLAAVAASVVSDLAGIGNAAFPGTTTDSVAITGTGQSTQTGSSLLAATSGSVTTTLKGATSAPNTQASLSSPSPLKSATANTSGSVGTSSKTTNGVSTIPSTTNVTSTTTASVSPSSKKNIAGRLSGFTDSVGIPILIGMLVGF